jgi:cation diffusion facilitator CzcD-associated flavoprotein CzcO
MSSKIEVPVVLVVIIGGGGCGLTASIFLNDLKVELLNHVLFERHPGIVLSQSSLQ